MTVVRDDILMYGFMIVSAFDLLYPSGTTTTTQMAEDAETNGWIRSILPNLEARLTIETFVDVSEVGM